MGGKLANTAGESAVPSPFWEIREGEFIAPDSLKNVRSAEGEEIAEKVRGIENGLTVFLRGSLLECSAPFPLADSDLLVVYDGSWQLDELRCRLPPGRIYDIKLIRRECLHEDYVFHALLQCRSLRLCGPPLAKSPIRADKRFAWEHWVKYCPSLLPALVRTEIPEALRHFKLLARCFGVLSFLKNCAFTRDIDACVEFARDEGPLFAAKLTEIRESLESCSNRSVPCYELKSELIRRFDVYYKGSPLI